jgi:hypothetical protein
MEIYSATKKNENLTFTGKWMELDNIIFSEVIQAQKVKSNMLSLIADYIPKTNAAILLDTDHTKGCPCTGGVGQGKETKNL